MRLGITWVRTVVISIGAQQPEWQLLLFSSSHHDHHAREACARNRGTRQCVNPPCTDDSSMRHLCRNNVGQGRGLPANSCLYAPYRIAPHRVESCHDILQECSPELRLPRVGRYHQLNTVPCFGLIPCCQGRTACEDTEQ